MTEYDYSPEAVERYMHNQSRVSNWVSSQSAESFNYSSPFRLTRSQADHPARFEHYAEEEPKSSRSRHAHHSRSHSSADTARPSTRGSHADGRGHARRHSSSSSRHHHSDRAPSSSAQSKPPSRSHTAKRSHRSRSATAPAFYSAPASSDATVTPTPFVSHSVPIANVPAGHKIFLPPGAPGQSYLIIPTQNQVASPTDDTPPRNALVSGASSPTKKALPLFKWLLNSLMGSSHRRSRARARSPSSSRTGSSGRSSPQGVRSWTLVEATTEESSSASGTLAQTEGLSDRRPPRKMRSGSRSAASTAPPAGSKSYAESSAKPRKRREDRGDRSQRGRSNSH